MTGFIIALLFTLLFIGFPFFVILIITLSLALVIFSPGTDLVFIVQQIINGIKPPQLIAIPLFILAANFITAGDSAARLIKMTKAYIGHITGGLPIVTNLCCTMFGSVSGSTQATVGAIGKTMRPMLLEAGYSSPFTLALIINASDIAYLIPPSIGAIIYGVAAQVSVGKLFMACVVPGLLIFVLFSIYSYFYSKYHGILGTKKASWKERYEATKEGILLFLFPIIVIGGIYSGIFSPTEAAAASVLYAEILELFIYRTLTINKVIDILLDTGIITAVVFILIGVGQALSWLLSYKMVPQAILPVILGPDPSALALIVAIIISYLIACMFVVPVVAIYVLSPIFAPFIISTGVDPIFIGVLVVLQSAIGSATPPFGCDIFTAQLIFKRPYLEVIQKTPVFILILMIATVIIIVFPQIATFLPNLMFN